MCNQCLSSSLSCSENYMKENEDENPRSFPGNALDSLHPLRQQWISWMLAPHLYSIGQALSKNLIEGESFTSKRTWKFFRHPCTIRSVLAFLFIFYVGVPVWFYLCPWMRRAAVYLHFADWPFHTLSHPEYYGLKCTRHFFVETSPGVLLGVWHILPCKHKKEATSSSFASDNQPVVLYLHGSAESRSAAYRRNMYNVLSTKPLHAHIITFDYRGFGDSTYVTPTAQTLEEDATAMFHWLNKHVPTSRIIVWGHSMGTGIAVRLGEAFAKQNASNPFAIILEAPFTSIADATRTFPLSFFHRRLPFFEFFCTERTRHPDTNLNSEDRVGSITAPLLILHAADDSMVWSEQGKELWKKAVESRPPHIHRPVFVELDGKYGCGHRNIHKAPNLPFVVSSFLQSVNIHNKAKEIN